MRRRWSRGSPRGSFWVPEHPEEGGSRRSARELDFEILVEKSMCLLGGRGVELEMADLGSEVGGQAEKSRERPEPRGASI